MRYFLLSLSLLLLPLGCGQDNASSSYAVEAMDGALSKEAANYDEVNEAATDSEESINKESKIIKTGNIRYEVKDLNTSFETLNQLIKSHSGFIQNDNSGSQYNYTYRNIIIRVPNKNFDKLLDAISKDVAYFDNKTITATDVTEEFIDVEARLKTKKILENRYLELLGKTNKIAEILEIEKSLSQIREEIESVQGRLNYLKNQISYSTLTIEIYQTSASGIGITESYPIKMWHAVVSGFNSLSGFILGVLTLWPYLIITAVIYILVRKRIWKRRKKSQIDKEQ
ncbi:DUF4349 domain-containing protein [Flavobacterium sp. NKUCC04_CG]|uniref:DUF4349 domain-containing protein n=1 Tax=Flavobacterium sp. NKUCC04_CG TaxID=2842121 RepID=UPI001C5AC43D|nr:DUF4349 domain-containing protein [Flavobacterium sp. NKUCC04_CG]MBW3518838.1 DUF4349 domain-containing protein [Flavobacterium sp. NKUCC04_CG]